MVNTNQGVDPNIARQFQAPFNANQLQGGGNAFNLGGTVCMQLGTYHITTSIKRTLSLCG